MAMRKFLSATVQAGDTVTNTATKTSFATKLVMDPTVTNVGGTGAGEQRYGETFNLDLHGYISTDAAPGTLELTIDHGQGNGGATLVVLGTCGAVTPPAGLSNAYWTFKGKVVINTTSNGAGIATASGMLTIVKPDGTTFCAGMVTPGAGTTGWASTLDTHGTNYSAIQASAKWSSALATNSITLAGGSTFERIA